MGFDFYPCITQDGSIGLFNTSVDDIYHSSSGAYLEALDKFINPSGLEEFLEENKTAKILDICYGMGYNTKTAIKTCLKIGSDASLFVDALEYDVDVFTFSLLCDDKEFDFWVGEFLDENIIYDERVLDSACRILNSSQFCPFLKKIFKSDHKDISRDEIKAILHNIYYENISIRNNKNNPKTQKEPLIKLLPALNDARKTVVNLQGTYDFIFLDAFTPIKLPTLWSVEFFKELYRLLSEHGNLTTYSNSAAIRNAMIEAGFFVGKSSSGTIAYKDEFLLKTPLDNKAKGLLKTKAGIPFYDPDLKSTKDEILKRRALMIESSNLEGSSQFLKNYTKNKLEL